ncbi:MAG: glycoside hydrolase family 13 protein [Bacteroidota bacterium]
MRFTLLLWCLVLSQNAIAQENADPRFQRFPPGTTKSTYQYRQATGKTVQQSRVEPPFWWVGMENPNVQLLVYDQDIRDYEVSINYPGARLLNTNRVENPNYLFLDIELDSTVVPGTMAINLTKGNEMLSYPYQLYQKPTAEDFMLGVDASDLLYLIMPDRFANGDTQNDQVEGMLQAAVDRKKVLYRHGGDLMGIMQHLDYLESLGVTTITLNPIQENDQPYDSYHGYAMTDHYQIDRRLGTNTQYRQLVRLCHARGMKVVMDIIHNHCGDQHWFIDDLPMRDWIHQGDSLQRVVYRAPVHMDPYASKADQQQVTNGWFDDHMPDLNQQNPLVANYLIQNHLWWALYSGHDGYRIDTYVYCDQAFLAEWGRRMQEELPKLCIFGETWVHGVAVQSQFTQNNNLRDGYNSHLPGVTDYQLHYGMMETLAGTKGWTDGPYRLYYALAKDFLYEDPYRNVIFLDNHDLNRIYSALDQNIEKLKTGMILLLTLRGIPMLYYGTEILMQNDGGTFGEAGRLDFPGGWPGDKPNKFKPEGRTVEEQAFFSFLQGLAAYRKNTRALQTGKLMQFIPEDGVYVYFRYDAEKTVMVLINSTDEVRALDTQRFSERIGGAASAKSVLDGAVVELGQQIVLGAHEGLVLELE